MSKPPKQSKNIRAVCCCIPRLHIIVNLRRWFVALPAPLNVKKQPKKHPPLSTRSSFALPFLSIAIRIYIYMCSCLFSLPSVVRPIKSHQKYFRKKNKKNATTNYAVQQYNTKLRLINQLTTTMPSPTKTNQPIRNVRILLLLPSVCLSVLACLHVWSASCQFNWGPSAPPWIP